MSTINEDGRAFNGNKAALVVAAIALAVMIAATLSAAL